MIPESDMSVDTPRDFSIGSESRCDITGPVCFSSFSHDDRMKNKQSELKKLVKENIRVNDIDLQQVVITNDCELQNEICVVCIIESRLFIYMYRFLLGTPNTYGLGFYLWVLT